MPTALVVTAHTRLARRLDRALSQAGGSAFAARTLSSALAAAPEAVHDFILVDVSLLGACPRQAIDQLYTAAPRARVVVISSVADLGSVVDCVRDNLVTVLARPIRRQDLERLFGVALRSQPGAASDLDPVTIAAEHGIIYASKVMSNALGLALAASRTSDPVTVLGETGTGKELVARLIHNAGARRAMPFVPVNCASLSGEIADAELFGRTKGAYTGAMDRRGGLFQQAAGGTLFLDEIGELHPTVQAKLLRALEDGEVRMVGSSRTEHVDVRVVAASNRNLQAEARAGRFRVDLYHRIACRVVRLPPLRERPADIPMLADHFLAQMDPGLRPEALAPAAIDALMKHAWPGNVRELRQVMRRVAAVAQGRVVTARDIRSTLSDERDQDDRIAASSDTPLSLHRFEHEALLCALNASQGNATTAARLLGIGRATFYRKLRSGAAAER